MHSWRVYVMWEVELARAMQDLFSFILYAPGVSRSPVSPRAVVMRTSLRLSIMHSAGTVSPRPSHLPTARPGYPVLPVVRRFYSRTVFISLFKETWAIRCGHPRAKLSLRYSGSSLLSCLYPIFSKPPLNGGFSQSVSE